MKIAIFVSKIGVYVGVTAFALSMPHVSFADESNYGAGFVGSPTLTTFDTSSTISTANYGQGFVGSPTLVGYNTYTFTTTGNYGAGYHTYGAPSSWSGYLGSYAWWW